MQKAEIRQGRGASTAVVAATVLFLLAQALGVTRTYFDITLFGYEVQVVWIIIAAVVVLLYAEVNDATRRIVKARDDTRAEISQGATRVAKQIEETIAAVEAKLKAKISS